MKLTVAAAILLAFAIPAAFPTGTMAALNANEGAKTPRFGTMALPPGKGLPNGSLFDFLKNLNLQFSKSIMIIYPYSAYNIEILTTHHIVVGVCSKFANR
jgi:hypothetical protein